jgi:hypothetical protein
MTGFIILFVAALLLAYFVRKNKQKVGLKVTTIDQEITPEERLAREERGAKYELKRINFKQNSLKYFNFLVEEFGYNTPEHKFNQQENGTIINDELRYMNEKLDRLIVIANGYHPYDYGFDVCFYRPSISTDYSDNSNIRHMALDVDKEKQDIDQTYVENAAKDLKENFLLQIKGETWFDE